MGLYKKGKSYFIDYYFPPGREGKRTRVKVGPNKQEAQILLAETMKEIRQGLHPSLGQIKPILFEVVAQEFLDKHASQKRSPESFQSNVNVLLLTFKGKVLQQITTAAIEDFKIARRAEGVEDSTINRNLAHLSSIFSFARRRKCFAGPHPVSSREGGVKVYQESAGRARFLSAKEADALVGKAKGHLKDIIITALHTGGRLTEILTLRRGDIDLTNGVLHFDQTNTKSGKRREIPIDPDLREVMSRRLKVRSISDQSDDGYLFTWGGKRIVSLKTAFLAARKASGLPGKGPDKVTFHTLRHTFASWYMINGGDLYRLQHYMGHQTVELTTRYAHLSPKHQREGVRFFGAPRENGSHSVDTSAGSTGAADSASA